MRGGSPGTRLQGRPDPRPVPDRAREDPALQALRNVRAASTAARDGHQARAPAGPDPVHQERLVGLMLPVAARERRGQWWRLALGTMVLAPFTPGSLNLVALTLAALLFAAGKGARRTR